MVRRVAAFALICCACSGVGDRGEREEVKLRVSTSHGFAELIPSSTSMVGTAGYVLPLVYDPLAKHARIVRVHGRSVLLERKSASPHLAGELADSLRYLGLEEAETVGGERIRARFIDEETSAHFSRWEGGVFALGPFELESGGEKKMTLRARSNDHALDVIEILAVDEEQQWRRLLARNVDVVPMTGAARAERLRDVGSIRLLPFPGDWQYGVLFNVHNANLEDAAVRRAIAGAIDVRAVAKISCGDPQCATAGPARKHVSAGLDVGPVPGRLSVLVQESDDVARLAAESLRHQFRRQGLTLNLDEASAREASERVSVGDYELAIVPLSVEPNAQLLEKLANLDYANEELEAAIKRGDSEAARAILDREVPFVTLFEARYYAALDESFCGARPGDTASWRWLADLHPCDQEDDK